MKVLLFNPTSPEPPPSYFGAPYGLSLLGAILKARGVGVVGRDFDRVPLGEMLDESVALVEEHRADLVGVSCQSSNRGAVAALVRRLKEAVPGLRVVVGGPFASTDPELVLRRCGADWVAVGDGEETLCELVEALKAGGDPRAVAGLVWSEDGRIRRAPPRRPFADLDSLPDPDFDLFGVAPKLESFRRPRVEVLAGLRDGEGRRGSAMRSAIMVLSSRGCVYRCVFCPMSMSQGAPRVHSPAYFAGMVARLSRRYGWRDFVFGDNFFTRDRARVLEICALLRRDAPGIEWICMTRADAMDAALARAMAAAGCREISYGVETGSPRVQRAIGKRLDLEKVPEAFRSTREAGMHAVLMMMVGNPGDDLETSKETSAFLRRFEPDRVLVHTTKVYPGTGIHATAVAAGVIPPGFYEGDEHEPPVYTVERTSEELEQMKSLLPRRTVYIEAGQGCVNGCCGLRRARPRDGLTAALARAAARAEGAVLGGGESLLTPGLDAALADASTLDLHDLALYTTARPLADDRRAAALRERPDTRRIIVPLLSPDAGRHDARSRVPGALAQTRLGMRRWLKRGGEAAVWLLPAAEDLPELAAWAARQAGEGAREILLVHREPPPGWGGMALEDAPPLAAFAAAAAAAAVAVGKAAALAVFGLPPCLWDGALAPRHEGRALYDEAVSGSGVPVSCRARRRPRQAFGAVCAGCALKESCDGTWADYLSLHGEGELRAS